MKLRKILVASIAVTGILASGSLLLWQDLLTDQLGHAAESSTDMAKQAEQPPDYSRVFSDIAGCYAQKEIVDLHDRGIINGVGERIFAPDKSITRAEFITMLDRTLGIEPLSSLVPAFQDVPKDVWSFGWIQAGVELGISNGTSISNFSPEQSISREQAAALLVRALKIKAGQTQSPLTPPFADMASVSGWAAEYVLQSNQSGLMQGYEGYFRPQEPISRQETAVVLYRILHNDNWGLQSSHSEPAKVHLGWEYDITTAEVEQRTAASSLLNTLSPRWFFLDAAGTFSDKADSSLVSWARANGKKVWPLVGNRFDRETTHRVLSEPQARQAAVAQLTEIVKQYQLDGLNLDFENLDPQDRDAFSTFVSELAASLHACQAQLTVDVPMDVGTDWSDPFDYAALGRFADYIVIMAYDEHWIGSSTAGSVASVNWMDRGIDKILAVVSPQKTIVGLPVYTRDWYSQNGSVVSDDITLSQQDNLLAKYSARYEWDASVGQYVAGYSKNGQAHTVWLEDSRSLALKYQLLDRKGVAGFAFWYIGAETPDVWKSLQNVQKYSAVGE